MGWFSAASPTLVLGGPVGNGRCCLSCRESAGADALRSLRHPKAYAPRSYAARIMGPTVSGVIPRATQYADAIQALSSFVPLYRDGQERTSKERPPRLLTLLTC